MTEEETKRELVAQMRALDMEIMLLGGKVGIGSSRSRSAETDEELQADYVETLMTLVKRRRHYLRILKEKKS